MERCGNVQLVLPAHILLSNCCQTAPVLNRLSKVSSSASPPKFSKSLLLRSIFIAAMIALIYYLQTLVDRNSIETEPSRETRAYFLPSLTGVLDRLP